MLGPVLSAPSKRPSPIAAALFWELQGLEQGGGGYTLLPRSAAGEGRVATDAGVEVT